MRRFSIEEGAFVDSSLKFGGVGKVGEGAILEEFTRKMLHTEIEAVLHKLASKRQTRRQRSQSMDHPRDQKKLWL